MMVLALDFDGVISDSAGESFLVALRTYARMRPECGWQELAGELVAGGAPVVRAHALYRAFLELMPLGNRAEDFGVALWILEHGESVPDQAAYDLHRRARPPEFLEDFHAAFYRERELLSNTDRDAWLRLLGPYPGFVELLRRRSGDAMLTLATAKDRRSVDLLLEAYGMADLFPDERIADKEMGVSKRAHLRALRDRLDVDFADITFVDDKVNHLESVAGLGVRCALAAWGYNGPREREMAHAQGYLVCSLEDAERRLFGEEGGPAEA